MTVSPNQTALPGDYAQPAARLGDGADMPLLGFGTWQIPDDEAEQSTTFALQAGYRHIDTATGYANEAGIGKALAPPTSIATRCSSRPRCRLTTSGASGRP